jgi:hypothetical protein
VGRWNDCSEEGGNIRSVSRDIPRFVADIAILKVILEVAGMANEITVLVANG